MDGLRRAATAASAAAAASAARMSSSSSMTSTSMASSCARWGGGAGARWTSSSGTSYTSSSFTGSGWRAAAATTTTTTTTESDDAARKMEIAIDRSGLRRALDRRSGKDDGGSSSTSSAPAKKRDGLLGHLERAIKFAGGSIPMSEYVRECLTHPQYGYYMRGDVFGKKGDFVTSPEISQVFGEMLGVWAALTHESLGSPKELRVVEFGPGRGTLMADLLRGTAGFDKFREAVSVHFIEVSPALRELQAKTLRCVDVEKTAVKSGFTAPKNVFDDEYGDARGDVSTPFVGEAHTRAKSEINGADVFWHDGLESVPPGPTLVICHEFFDALPVRQFQRTDRGWCEKLITIDSGLSEGGEQREGAEKVVGRDLEMVLSPGPTPASHVLVSRRLKALPKEQADSLRLLELSPPSLALWDRLADHIEKHSGAVLAIDYGEEGPLGNTLEAIKDHKFVHILDTPGEADLSAYVDFGGLRQIIEEKPGTGVKCYGPVTQQQLLLSLGLVARLEKLVENASSEDQADELIKGCERLVGEGAGDESKGEPPGMGVRYKAMSMVSLGVSKPVGF